MVTRMESIKDVLEKAEKQEFQNTDYHGNHIQNGYQITQENSDIRLWQKDCTNEWLDKPYKDIGLLKN